MFKFLLVLFLISYTVYKVGGFLFKILFIGAANAQSQRRQQQQTYRRPAPKSNLNIDHIPQKGDKGNLGGDYVDYEEVK